MSDNKKTAKEQAKIDVGRTVKVVAKVVANERIYPDKSK